MGIRYERDDYRKTNGPMIFFNDLFSIENLKFEINRAWEKNIIFYAYKFPGEDIYNFGTSEKIFKGIHCPGFIIHPFDPDSDFFTIPFFLQSSDNEDSKCEFNFPEVTVGFDEYKDEIEAIKNKINENIISKAVAARTIIKNGEVNLGESFYNLSLELPDAFIFCFSSPATGCWIGASPELLFKRNGSLIESMALAGTRISGVEAPWDSKNKEEQRYVKNYIENIFQENGFKRIEIETTTLKAGKIEHICTLFRSEIPEKITPFSLPLFLKELSPTPALCGIPKKETYDILIENENFNRAFYGGFCGPCQGEKNYLFQVILRCAWIRKKDYALFAGGGITKDSVAEEEWKETERKLDSYAKALILEK